jgi:hypothetical protein
VVRAVDAEDRRELLALPAGTSTAALGSGGERLTSTEGAGSWTLAFDQDRSRTWSVQASLGTLQAPFAPCAVTLDGRPLQGWSYDPATTALAVDVPTQDGVLVARACAAAGPTAAGGPAGQDGAALVSRRALPATGLGAGAALAVALLASAGLLRRRSR